jgi:hypothetical protein
LTAPDADSDRAAESVDASVVVPPAVSDDVSASVPVSDVPSVTVLDVAPSDSAPESVPVIGVAPAAGRRAARMPTRRSDPDGFVHVAVPVAPAVVCNRSAQCCTRPVPVVVLIWVNPDGTAEKCTNAECNDAIETSIAPLVTVVIDGTTTVVPDVFAYATVLAATSTGVTTSTPVYRRIAPVQRSAVESCVHV